MEKMEKYNFKFKCDHFNLKHTLDCGQCFRWKCIYAQDKKNIYEYIGVIEDRVVRIRQEEDDIFVCSNRKEYLKEKIFSYFDINKDYEKIEDVIRKIDKNISESLKYSSGLHILNQPVFETIISYIISANNNIKRISGSVEKISKKFGKKIDFEGEEYYLFPSLQELKKAKEEDMLECGVGFRARYVIKTVKKLRENSQLLLDYDKMNREELQKELLSYMGIGPKVAGCIMLFCMQKGDAFPIDVWVKRVMEKLYFKKNTSIKEISKYAKDDFGEYAGLIQQHLFYNIREENI